MTTEEVKDKIDVLIGVIGASCDGADIDYANRLLTLYTEAGQCKSSITFTEIKQLASMLEELDY